MSCLRIRLPPAKKAWKSFTSKIQAKLHKLHKSKTKTITPKHLVPEKTTNSSKPSSLILLRKRFKRKRCRAILSRHMLKAKTEPIYIDQLFKEPVTELVLAKRAKLVPSSRNATTMVRQSFDVHNSPPRLESGLFDPTQSVRIPSDRGQKRWAKAEDQYQDAAPPGSSAGDSEESFVADDMWESTGLASIDERAEEFITRFRAEMELQEIIARNL